MPHPTEYFAARIDAEIGHYLDKKNPGLVEAALVRGLELRLGRCYSAQEVKSLRGKCPSGMRAEEFLTVWTRLCATSRLETPAPEVTASWTTPGVFQVEIRWTPERLPWGGVVVPDGIPKEGPLGKSPKRG